MMKTKKMRITKWSFALLVVLLSSCGGEEVKQEDNAPRANSTTIEVTNKQFELGNMVLGTMTTKEFHSNMKVNGMLDVPPENKATVSVYFGGYVKEVKLLPGEQVRKGQKLFVLENPDYVQVQQDFLEAKSRFRYLKQDFDRQKSLADGNVSSQKTVSKAESDYKIAFAQFESLKKKLTLMNLNPNSVSENNLRSTITVTAPISGYVTAVNITKGMFLNPSDIALTIMNGDVIHVELTVFEQDLGTVAVGQNVNFRLDNDEQKYQAVVHLINKAIDPEKRTINVHCDLKNEKQSKLFTPGMYVEAEIETTKTKSLSLPVEAVVNLGEENYVLLLKKKGKQGYEFERKLVKVGETNEGFIQVINASDFQKNTVFLLNGSFNLIKD